MSLQGKSQQLSGVEIGPQVYAVPVKSFHPSCGSLPEPFDGGTKANTKVGVLCRNYRDVLWSSSRLFVVPKSGKTKNSLSFSDVSLNIKSSRMIR